MFCPVCGKPLEPLSAFCQSCGAANPSASASRASASPKKSSALKFVFIGCAILILLGAGVVAAVFFGIKHAFKSSEAAKAAVLALQQSNNARAALGEITDVGTPMGSISSEAGGSGTDSLSETVTGTKARGEYYATLQRKNGQWFLLSGRLQLSDGSSVNIEGLALGTAAGLQLRNGAVDTTSWIDAGWPERGMSLRLPSDWIQEKMNQRELEFRAGEMHSSTYLIVNAWMWERDLPAENLLAADAQTASESLKNGVIAGYAIRELGGAPGVLTISDVGDRRTATLKAIVQINGVRMSIDVTLGAQNRDFERLGPMFNSIFDSIRFNQAPIDL